ncbi:MAG: Trp family transcriptional regulator [Microgenomates group bacterium]
MKEKIRLFNQLRDLFISIKSNDEMENLLLGILSPQELDEVATRLEIVRLLKNGTPQKQIAEKLAVGIATVTRGSREIKRGRFKYVN